MTWRMVDWARAENHMKIGARGPETEKVTGYGMRTVLKNSEDESCALMTATISHLWSRSCSFDASRFCW